MQAYQRRKVPAGNRSPSSRPHRNAGAVRSGAPGYRFGRVQATCSPECLFDHVAYRMGMVRNRGRAVRIGLSYGAVMVIAGGAAAWAAVNGKTGWAAIAAVAASV